VFPPFQKKKKKLNRKTSQFLIPKRYIEKIVVAPQFADSITEGELARWEVSKRFFSFFSFFKKINYLTFFERTWRSS